MLKVLFFVFMLGVSSRGLFELVFEKGGAYFIQLALICLSLLLALNISRARILRKDMPMLVLACLVAFVGVLSMQLTLIVEGNSYFPYILVLLFTSALVAMSLALGNATQFDVKAFVQVVVLWSWILVGVALAQQLRMETALPGSSPEFFLPRPASLTGSYLHYPLIVSMTVFIALEAYAVYRRKIYLVSAFAFVVAIFLSLSRSGMFIVIFGLMLYYLRKAVFFVSSFRLMVPKKFFFLISFSLMLLPIVLLQAVSASDENLAKVVLERFFTAGSVESAGNTERVEQWVRGLELWGDTNLFIGEYFGIVTNSSKNILGEDSFIVESGLIQNLLNIGLLGVIIYYALMLLMLNNIGPSYKYLKFGFLAAVAQTFFYQSNEVIPYLCMLVVIPLVSRHLDVEAARKVSEPKV